MFQEKWPSTFSKKGVSRISEVSKTGKMILDNDSMSVVEINKNILFFLASYGERLANPLGISSGLLSRIQNLPLQNFRPYSKNLLVKVDRQALEEWVTHSESQAHNLQIVERALELGARYDMILTFTGLPRAKYHSLRRMKGLAPLRKGRIKSLNEKQQREIWEYLDGHLISGMDSLKYLCSVAEATNIELERIWDFLSSLELGKRGASKSSQIRINSPRSRKW